MKAFLLGAGASKGYSSSRTGVAPPLAKEFFSTYFKLEIASDPDVLVGNIVNYVRDTRGIDPTELEFWNEDVESFLTEVEHKLANLGDDFGEQYHIVKTYDEMVFLFASVLNEIQNGDLSEDFRKLVRLSTEDDALITFNWDTLLDRALWEDSHWSPENGYCLPFQGIYDDGWKNPSTTGKRRLIFKLHGSTNWLVPYYSFNFEEHRFAFNNRAIDENSRPIYCFLQSRGKFKTYKGRSRAGYEPFSYYYYPPNLPIENKPRPGYATLSSSLRNPKSVVNDPETYSMPLLIAPVQHKNYHFLGNVLSPIWDGAEAAISICEELHIIGYSFPKTDLRAMAMISDACSRRTKPLKVFVANPCPADIKDCLMGSLAGAVDIEVLPMFFHDYLDWLAARS